MEKKTNACRILDKQKIAYCVHDYDVSDGVIDGMSVAKKCNQDSNRVFKTLVTVGNDGQNYVFVIPVCSHLNLKAAAKSVNVKNVEMIPLKTLFPVTGYVHGGCSPVGMKKSFCTVIDESAVLFDTILVSAGKIGKQIEIKPGDLLAASKATYSAIADEG